MWNSKHNWQKIPDLTCSMTRPKRHNCLGRRRAISSFFFISSRPANSTGARDGDSAQSASTSQPSRHLCSLWCQFQTSSPHGIHTSNAKLPNWKYVWDKNILYLLCICKQPGPSYLLISVISLIISSYCWPRTYRPLENDENPFKLPQAEYDALDNCYLSFFLPFGNGLRHYQ